MRVGEAENTEEEAQPHEARAPIGHQTQIGRSGCHRSARSDWWAVKDSNLGPA